MTRRLTAAWELLVHDGTNPEAPQKSTSGLERQARMGADRPGPAPKHGAYLMSFQKALFSIQATTKNRPRNNNTQMPSRLRVFAVGSDM